MNAVEVEQAVTALFEQPFDPAEFPFAFLQAFGNKETTLKRLRRGESNKSDLNGVLQTGNIHVAVAPPGEVTSTLAALKASSATARAKAKFILATDGDTLEAEDMLGGETIACAYEELPDYFSFLLPLAGITTVKQVRESAFDIRATSRLNRLYVQLLQDNPDWGTVARRPDMNHFMARLIFCFFAERTGIFFGDSLFTNTVAQMSVKDGADTHEVIGELFRAMNTSIPNRAGTGLRSWADSFPYVNGGLFSGSPEAPRFSRIARVYLLHIGGLDWTRINPDIFGSMIQAVAEDEERGALGMHYTSVPNILKVLNPLFLDDLRAKLAEAEDNGRKLLNLRNRLSCIRVFDPACGSGNFLVIAYKEMRGIEAEINARRGEAGCRSVIPLTNFRGIEIKHFPAEIARLALIIAEFQCDVLHRGQKEALAEFLPLDAQNWITCGNALRLDWLSICPPTGTGVKHQADDLFHTPLDQAQIDFENQGGETYVCGNPPYKGGTEQSQTQKDDMAAVLSGLTDSWKSLDYVCGWFTKFTEFSRKTQASCAFVSTNSITQGEQVARLWPLIYRFGLRIIFAYASFKWANLASHNAGVTVVIIGLGAASGKVSLFETSDGTTPNRREVDNICSYLIAHSDILIEARSEVISEIAGMINGNKPADGGHLVLRLDEARVLQASDRAASHYVRKFVGAADSIHGVQRYCLWVRNEEKSDASNLESLKKQFALVRDFRSSSTKELTRKGAHTPHAFQQVRQVGNEVAIVVPRHSSVAREYLPVGLYPRSSIVADGAFALYDAPIWNFAILTSNIHLVWIAAVCGKIKTDYRYSSTLGWNTYPVPTLTDANKVDLASCAEAILLAREAHFPATIAELYNPDRMPADLREAHERNDDVLERVYIGRRFRNDTERLEKLFEMYTRMAAAPKPARPTCKARKASA